jgi:hypothetical protein
VGRLAIDFCDNPLWAPECVDLEALDPHVYLRKGDAVAQAQVEEQVLLGAEGPCILRAVMPERLAEGSGAGAAVAQLLADGIEVEDPQIVSLGDCATEDVELAGGREVEERL